MIRGVGPSRPEYIMAPRARAPRSVDRMCLVEVRRVGKQAREFGQSRSAPRTSSSRRRTRGAGGALALGRPTAASTSLPATS